MNTVGKTLVIVNLLFALITGAFFVIDFMTRTNWKQRYEELEREVTAAKAVTEADRQSLVNAIASLRESEKKIKDLENKNKKDEADYKVALNQYENRIEDLKREGVKGTAITLVADGELGRLREEVKHLSNSLKKREEMINLLEVEKNKALDQAVTALGLKNAAEERSASLLTRLEEVERAYLRLSNTQGVASSPLPTLKNSNAANPPPAYVKGIVEKVDSSGLVQISIGTDQGINVNHTLEAYRLRPRPEYLGMIRIQEANAHKAVGRLMRSGAMAQQPSLRAGDEVASSLRPSY